MNSSAFARRLQRSHASISRELRRNLWGGRQYWPPRAQILARARLQNRACRERLKSKRGRAYVHQQLQKGWTPELIAGRLHRQKKLPSVCHESIYQYIYAVAPDLSGLLPRHHAKRKPKRPYRKTGARIPNRTSVALHAPAATARREYGHWEADTLVAGDRQHGLNVLVERKSRLTHLSLLVTKTAARPPNTRSFEGCTPILTPLPNPSPMIMGVKIPCMKRSIGPWTPSPSFVRPTTVGRKGVWNRLMD